MSELQHYGVKGMKWGKRRAARKAEVNNVFNKYEGKQVTYNHKNKKNRTLTPSDQLRKQAAKRIVKGKNISYNDAVRDAIYNNNRTLNIMLATGATAIGVLGYIKQK